jgi:hypothetical protein
VSDKQKQFCAERKDVILNKEKLVNAEIKKVILKTECGLCRLKGILDKEKLDYAEGKEEIFNKQVRFLPERMELISEKLI